MTAFVPIDCLTVTDPGTLNAQCAPSGATVECYGGHYVLPYGSQIETLEGTWKLSMWW